MDHIPPPLKIWFQFIDADHKIQDKVSWNCAESLVSWRDRDPRYWKSFDKSINIIRHFKEMLPKRLLWKDLFTSEQKWHWQFRRNILYCINMFWKDEKEMFRNGHFHIYSLNLWNCIQETLRGVYVFSWFRMKWNFSVPFSPSLYGLHQIYVNTRLHL